jgi:hypothetical protein
VEGAAEDDAIVAATTREGWLPAVRDSLVHQATGMGTPAARQT